MSIFKISDTSTGNVLNEIEANHLTVKGHIVKFYKNSYDKVPNGVLVLHQNIAVLEQMKQPEETK